MTNEEIWRATLAELELTLSKANFTTWFKNTCILYCTDGEFTIGVPSGFIKEWLQNKYHKNISTALQNVTNARIRKISYELNIHFKKQESTPSALPQKESLTAPFTQSVQPEESKGLNPKYTFNAFIVGSSNELARAAAAAVAQTPGSIYNPLFIYGGVGLGKTHLVQAVGNQLREKTPNANVVYVTSEKFTNDFIEYIRSGKGKTTTPSSFKNTYRSADILIVDDIQFISGKEGTQEQFFHTFNELYHNNKQIILTSDRPPKAINALEDRLLSRFEGGMVADVGIPNQETRKAILECKCKERGVEFSNDILTYIAEHIQNNIRELEGALSRLIAHCQLSNIVPTIDTTKSVLAATITKPQTEHMSPKQILEIVSTFYSLSADQLIAKNRKKEIAWPRQIAMFLMREESKTSYPTIGQELGGRDHTTAMHAYEKVSRALEEDENLRQEIDIIRQKLYSQVH
ncbi:chromosomal replication initiator protein DnaA [Patescibacteria group bacterium]|nr:chromosomal replication initiator protein DnaA [Patescibacteria group bacterium]